MSLPDRPSATLYPDLYEQLPAGYEDLFENMTGRGRNPRVIVATTHWLEGRTSDNGPTQEQVAERFDVSEVSIRSCKAALRELGYLE